MKTPLHENVFTGKNAKVLIKNVEEILNIFSSGPNKQSSLEKI